MNNKENKKLYTFRIHIEQLEYLRNSSVKNFTTVSQYLANLINDDMKKKSKNG